MRLRERVKVSEPAVFRLGELDVGENESRPLLLELGAFVEAAGLICSSPPVRAVRSEVEELLQRCSPNALENVAKAGSRICSECFT